LADPRPAAALVLKDYHGSLAARFEPGFLHCGMPQDHPPI
jgi:hypothetical protein